MDDRLGRNDGKEFTRHALSQRSMVAHEPAERSSARDGPLTPVVVCARAAMGSTPKCGRRDASQHV
jgi:hypothetical protein